ncbi:hypothetical protein [Rhodococcus opacus]|uniref:Uncharacterized protein n=1 Tax=Rhodococcus opacus (strain B4) TaxID=632772 RepID=C1B9B2_RHOOB|nr:hypothetical protein [Rhodococcus opacus]BAH52265.1 hypothetical protein ROP_40180 [Rhodococcus opacus B4]
MKRIALHSSTPRIVKIITDEFEARGTTIDVFSDRSDDPVRADLVLSTAATNSVTEWLAARLGCYVAVLPEALDYVRSMLDKQGTLVLVGSDRGKA